MKRMRLALRLLYRDGRSGELTILILALIIAVTGSTAISLFADRLSRTMTKQAAEFLAADLVITSPSVLPSFWKDKADELNLQKSWTAEFSSVLIENDEMLLAGVKAAEKSYPLRGYLKTAVDDGNADRIEHSGPGIGEAWVERRVLSALKLELGDELQVGEKRLRIARIVTYEPDKRGDLYSLSPRVMISAGDLYATEVLQPGSHVHYFFHFAGDAEALKAFSRWAKPRLNPSQRLMDIHEDRPEIGTALKRAERYLGLSSIVVVLISGVAIAMATRRYTERHFNATAILRCLGCRQSEILALYCYQFTALGTAASLVGCLSGWFAQEWLFHLLKNLLPQAVSNPGPMAVLFGFATGMATLFGFAFPPLLRLRGVSPLRVFRRELEPLPSSAWMVYGLAMSVIAALVWRYTGDPQMTFSIVGVGLAAVAVLGALVYFLLAACRGLLPGLNLTWRFGLQGLIKQPEASISQILAFAITAVAMLLSFSVRTDLLEDWQAQLPENAPNHFVLNIFPEQLEEFRKDLSGQGIEGNRYYPIVRGRLVKINGEPVQRIVSKDSTGEQATHRDLSLTWSGVLPEENKIVRGQWTTEEQRRVSIEQRLAESLKVDIGDRLTFTVGSRQFEAVVSSIRHVEWDTMRPNFYMIFSPGTLEGYATTYITSFFLPPDRKNYLNALVKRYPGVTVLEVDLILRQFKTILAQITRAIDYLLFFALLAGVTVLFASLYSTLDQRIRDGALLRTLGANRLLLRKSQFIEFSLLGLIAGLLSVLICETVTYFLYTHVLAMDYSPRWGLWAAIPLMGGLFVGLTGFWGVRRAVNTSPVQVLREI
ncbi:MAG: ABC transporter permease [Gammaproteobacteria bacterium]